MPSHYNIGLHDSSIQTDMFWGKQSGKRAEGGCPHGRPGCRRRARRRAPALRVLRSRRESAPTCHMDSPPPPRWSTERKALMGEGSLLLGGPHRLAE